MAGTKRVVEGRMGWHIVVAVVDHDHMMDRNMRGSLKKTVNSRGQRCNLGKTSWSWLEKGR